MCQDFQTYLPARLAEVGEALRDRDAPRLREAAHKLCALLFAFSTAAGNAASDLEDHAAQGRLEEARPLVEQLEAMARELIEQVDGLSLEARCRSPGRGCRCGPVGTSLETLAACSRGVLSMTEPSGYALEAVWEDGEFVLSRGVREGEPSPLLVMAPASARPAPGSLARLEHAFVAAGRAGPRLVGSALEAGARPGAAHAGARGPRRRAPVRLLGQPWEITSLLRVAIGLAATFEHYLIT